METTGSKNFKNGYANVNGLSMYYEIYGEGEPLVLLHGGGSTIGTTFGRIIPKLSKSRLVIAPELQAHGRTGDRNTPLSFEQDADDVAALLKSLNLRKADFFGFSNGGTTTLQIAIRHPEIVGKIILGSALSKRAGVSPELWDFMAKASLDSMPAKLSEAYLAVVKDPAALQNMHDRDVERMLNFKDISQAQLKSVTAPTLIINGDHDVITTEHALEMHRLIADSSLAILPGGHGDYIEEITTIDPENISSAYAITLIAQFLDRKST